MEVRLSGATGRVDAEIRLARPAKAVRPADFAARLLAMQATVGARHFAVLRTAGHGLPAARRLAVTLTNWGPDTGETARMHLDAHGAALLAHLEASMLPLVWEGAGDGQRVEADADPFVRRLPARLLSTSGIAFPVRSGAQANGYVLFTGNVIRLPGDLVVEMHLKSCQVVSDMLAGEERKAAPAEALSEREIACLQMAADGCISETIATRMGLSVHTVNAHLGTAAAKLDAVNRIQAIAKAIRLGHIA